MKPTTAAYEVERQIPFKFGISQFVRAWKSEAVRPPNGDTHPERTKQDFCIYDKPHRDYVYTPAFVEYLVSKVGTEEGFRVLTRLDPIAK